MRFNLPLIFTAFGIALVFYLSWLPQPQLGLNWFIPSWLATWADANNNNAIRTGVPFVFISFITGIWLNINGHQVYSWLAAWLILTLVVIIAEVGQLFLPLRSFDIKDIVWGTTGTLVGLVVSIIIILIRNLLKGFLDNKRSTNAPD